MIDIDAELEQEEAVAASPPLSEEDRLRGWLRDIADIAMDRDGYKSAKDLGELVDELRGYAIDALKGKPSMKGIPSGEFDDYLKTLRHDCVIIESPYAGDIERNVAYARACLRDSLLRGEAPIASHLLYTQPGVLDDNDPDERKRGIDAGLAWRIKADKHVFYTDLGMSPGMVYAENAAKKSGALIEYRKLYVEMPGEAPPVAVGPEYRRFEKRSGVTSEVGS
jgi:hypothetical protein